MLKYLGVSFYLLYLALFRPLTLGSDVGSLKESGTTYIPFRILILWIILCAGLPAALFAAVQLELNPGGDYPERLITLFFSVYLFGLMLGLLVGLVFGLLFGMFGALLFCIFMGLTFGFFILSEQIDDWTELQPLQAIGNAVGLGFFLGLGSLLGTSIILGVACAFGSRVDGGPVAGRSRWMALVLFVLLGIGWTSFLAVRGEEQQEPLGLVVAYYALFSMMFLVLTLRLPLLPVYLYQYWRLRHSIDPIELIGKSPVYWDELGPYLPLLERWLLKIVEVDFDGGLEQIRHVAHKRPFQRAASQHALLAVLRQELQKLDAVDKLSRADQVVASIPFDAELTPMGFGGAVQRLGRIAAYARDYTTRVSPRGKAQVLTKLEEEVINFEKASWMTRGRIGVEFGALGWLWLKCVRDEQEDFESSLEYPPLFNPYVVGNPLRVEDGELFKGRRDVIVSIEEHAVHSTQNPSLFLYGRRRFGKTSVLQNLSRLLKGEFVSVYVDLQDAIWRETDAAFCYQLTRHLRTALEHNHINLRDKEPRLEKFENYPFTILSEQLDIVERRLKRARRRVLLAFDEYERLGEGVQTGRVTTQVLNTLRNIIQHREQMVVLFAGSHLPEAQSYVDWSDYLINLKVVSLGFLSEQDARELLTEPVPELNYDECALKRVLVLTGCQPYLVQAVAADVVDNPQCQAERRVRMEHVEQAVDSVVVSSGSYFHNLWSDCTAEEQVVLLRMALGESSVVPVAERSDVIRALCEKMLARIEGDKCVFTMGLFRNWIRMREV